MQLVSVIIPCYNQGLFLEECIESVDKQTYSNIEIIIVNDGSDDQHTIDILKIIEIKYPKIKVLSIKNSGVSTARNLGIENSSGEYILPLDGDDKIEKTYISKCVKILNEKKNVDVVYCIGKCFGSKGSIFVLDDFSEIKMLKRNLVFCTAMYRKKDFKQSGGYNPNMIYGYEDWDFWLSMIELEKKFYRINEILFYYRIKAVSRSVDNQNNKEKKIKMIQQIISNHEKLYKKHDFNINYENNEILKNFENGNTILNRIKSRLQKIKLIYNIFRNQIKIK